jgi:hypothetical protein
MRVPRLTAAGGRANIRRLLFASALVLVSMAVREPMVAFGATDRLPTVIVGEKDGVYSVTARFHVADSAAIARAVLTDYEQIPRFMSTIKMSVVRERTADRAIVEQEAVSRLLLFSKRIHLLLEIVEETDTLHFRDRCGTSFSKYQGSWHISEDGGRTEIEYMLTAQPTFDVPEFVLTRVLQRDSARMITQLQREIATRAAR